jgi:3-oxoacyl-[acyl-carrier protein] reductase
MGKLDGKVAIVTGAARGLGRAYAKRLAGLGAKVAVADLNLRSYEEFEAEAKDMTADSTGRRDRSVERCCHRHRGRCP